MYDDNEVTRDQNFTFGLYGFTEKSFILTYI